MLKFLENLGVTRDLTKRNDNLLRSIPFFIVLGVLILATWSWTVLRYLFIALWLLTFISVIGEKIYGLAIKRSINIYYQPNYTKYFVYVVSFLTIFTFVGIKYRGVISNRIMAHSFLSPVMGKGTFPKALSLSPFYADDILTDFLKSKPQILSESEVRRCRKDINNSIEEMILTNVSKAEKNNDYEKSDAYLINLTDSIITLEDSSIHTDMKSQISDARDSLKSAYETFLKNLILETLKGENFEAAYSIVEAASKSRYYPMARSKVIQILKAIYLQESPKYINDVTSKTGTKDFDGARKGVTLYKNAFARSIANVNLAAINNTSSTAAHLLEEIAKGEFAVKMEKYRKELTETVTQVRTLLDQKKYQAAIVVVDKFQKENPGDDAYKIIEMLKSQVRNIAKYDAYSSFFSTPSLKSLGSYLASSSYVLSSEERAQAIEYKEYLVAIETTNEYPVAISKMKVTTDGDRTFDGKITLSGPGGYNNQASATFALERGENSYEINNFYKVYLRSKPTASDLNASAFLINLQAKKKIQSSYESTTNSYSVLELSRRGGQIQTTDRRLGVTVTIHYSFPEIISVSKPILPQPGKRPVFSI